MKKAYLVFAALLLVMAMTAFALKPEWQRPKQQPAFGYDVVQQIRTVFGEWQRIAILLDEGILVLGDPRLEELEFPLFEGEARKINCILTPAKNALGQTAILLGVCSRLFDAENINRVKAQNQKIGNDGFALLVTYGLYDSGAGFVHVTLEPSGILRTASFQVFGGWGFRKRSRNRLTLTVDTFKPKLDSLHSFERFRYLYGSARMDSEQPGVLQQYLGPGYGYGNVFIPMPDGMQPVPLEGFDRYYFRQRGTVASVNPDLFNTVLGLTQTG